MIADVSTESRVQSAWLSKVMADIVVDDERRRWLGVSLEQYITFTSQLTIVSELWQPMYLVRLLIDAPECLTHLEC